MMPDLGPYAVPVISAYVAAIVLIIGLVVWTARQSAQARRALEDAERKVRK